MPSLIEMCTEALNDIGSLVVPTYLFENEDDTAKQIISISKKTGRELARMKWQQLEKDAVITTAPGTGDYALPADFRCMISDTMWNATNAIRVFGQETARDWSTMVNSPVTGTAHHVFRIRGDRVHIHPAPASVFSIYYEYRSSWYCQNSDGVSIAEWIADSNEPTIPSDVFIAGISYYFRKGNGMQFSDQEAEYNTILDNHEATNKPSGIIDMGAAVPRRRNLRGYLNIPDKITGF